MVTNGDLFSPGTLWTISGNPSREIVLRKRRKQRICSSPDAVCWISDTNSSALHQNRGEQESHNRTNSRNQQLRLADPIHLFRHVSCVRLHVIRGRPNVSPRLHVFPRLREPVGIQRLLLLFHQLPKTHSLNSELYLHSHYLHHHPRPPARLLLRAGLRSGQTHTRVRLHPDRIRRVRVTAIGAAVSLRESARKANH